MLKQLGALAKDNPEAADKVKQFRAQRQAMWDQERARASHVASPRAAGRSFQPSNSAAELHGSSSSVTSSPWRRALPNT